MQQVVLLTDFGLNDLYVGILKGVISGISPDVNIIDLTHSIQPQSIKQAAFILKNSLKYFNKGAIFVCVVDPGVGSERKPIAVQTENYLFIAPDNGLLSYVIGDGKVINTIELTEKKYYLPEQSNTFHGRDIFAPVAANLCNGIDILKMGNKIDSDSIIKLNPLKLEITENQLIGEVIYADNFGNLITSIPSKMIHTDYLNHEINFCNHTVKGITKTYSDVKSGDMVVYIGSFGYLEIGINLGNLGEYLNYKIGDDIIVKLNIKN